jgi:hypothetical protein
VDARSGSSESLAFKRPSPITHAPQNRTHRATAHGMPSFFPYSSFPHSVNGAQAAWSTVTPESGSLVTSQTGQRQSPLRRERHDSASSHTELPSSIKLSPPPGEVPPLPKTPQKVKQMNRKKPIEEYVPSNVDRLLTWMLNTLQATGHPGSCKRRTYRWSFTSAPGQILTTTDRSFRSLYG